MTKNDFLWYATEITAELARRMYVRDWDMYLALAKDDCMKTETTRTEIEAYAQSKQAYIRFSEEYWMLFDETEKDIIDAMYESITHELAHLWFKEGDEEHVCSMVTRVLRRY